MTHEVAPPFEFSSGPRDAKIALVGEALGEQEVLAGRPFVGNAGQELSRLLAEAGIERSECFLTNVIAARPSPTSNNFDLICASKAEVGGKNYLLPMIKQGKYLKPEYLGELDRLKLELEEVSPNVVVALGGKASWALLGNPAISRIRGTVSPSSLVVGSKVLATYHPSYLFQVWSDRPIVLVDLAKAKREAAYREFRRPERQVIVSPTLEELALWVEETLTNPPRHLSCDIETVKRKQIEMIGFARSRKEAIVVPFVLTKPYRSYWPTIEEEIQARKLCNILLSSPIPKLGQNILFDIQHLLNEGFMYRGSPDDTMLLHHAMYPELKKGLGFLGSIYSNEPAWKLDRKRTKEEELKKDD